MTNVAVVSSIAVIAVVVFAAFFDIGLALPVLPLYVHDQLGLSAFVVGLVSGGQFLAALASRLWAGRITDRQGPKRAVIYGLVATTAGGVCYLLSLMFLVPGQAVSMLLIGRTLVGGGESLIITGGMLWALGRVSVERSAQAIAWVGMSMFAAMAAAAPVGAIVYARYGFVGIAVASIAIPVAVTPMALALRGLTPIASDRAPLGTVMKAVLLPGLALSLGGITFGAVTTFLFLHFSARGWQDGAIAFSLFAVALIACRVLAGHLPDRLGGARVAAYSLVVQAIGLLMIGNAASAWLAIAGSVICGTGFSLVFPSLALEAVRRVPPANRGSAMGIYNAFLDLTLGVGSPALGMLATYGGINAVFDFSAAAAIAALPIVVIVAARGGEPGHRHRFTRTKRQH